MQGSLVSVQMKSFFKPVYLHILFVLYSLYLLQALTFPLGAKLFAGLLLLLGLVLAGSCVVRSKVSLFQFDREERFLLTSFALFSLVSIMSFFYWPHSREAQMRLEDYGTFLLLLPLFLVLRQIQFKFLHLVILLAVVATVLGVVSIIQYVSMKYFGQYVLTGESRMSHFWLRPSGGVNPMRYGAISLIFACFALNGVLLIRNKTGWLKALLGLAVGLALVACLLAKVRGSWLALPVLMVAYGGYLYMAGHPRFMLGLLVGGILTIFAVSQTQVVQSRVNLAVANVQDYIDGNAQTSLGARLDMFKASGILISQKPLWGHGLNSYSSKATEIRKATPGMSYEVGMWHNPHNEILQVMVEKGVVGLITLILLFAAPAYMFVKALCDRRVEVRYYAMNGLAILIVYAVAGQSVALFEHDVFNHFFALMILLFASQISSFERGDELAG